MESIKIEGYKGKYYVPTVDFNLETGVCELTGESFLESTVEFYEPLISWLNEFATTQKRPLTFNVKLTYYNTSSSKRLVDILRTLKEYKDAGGEVVVNWYIEDAEFDLIDEIEDYKYVSQMDVNILVMDEE